MTQHGLWFVGLLLNKLWLQKEACPQRKKALAFNNICAIRLASRLRVIFPGGVSMWNLNKNNNFATMTSQGWYFFPFRRKTNFWSKTTPLSSFNDEPSVSNAVHSVHSIKRRNSSNHKFLNQIPIGKKFQRRWRSATTRTRLFGRRGDASVIKPAFVRSTTRAAFFGIFFISVSVWHSTSFSLSLLSLPPSISRSFSNYPPYLALLYAFSSLSLSLFPSLLLAPSVFLIFFFLFCIYFPLYLFLPRPHPFFNFSLAYFFFL